MAISVYKMSRAELVAELESFPMEVIGNLNDLRDSVKLGRAIVKSCSCSKLDSLMQQMTVDETINIDVCGVTWTIDIDRLANLFVVIDGMNTYEVVKSSDITKYIQEYDSIDIYDNITGNTRIII